MKQVITIFLILILFSCQKQKNENDMFGIFKKEKELLEVGEILVQILGFYRRHFFTDLAFGSRDAFELWLCRTQFFLF